MSTVQTLEPGSRHDLRVERERLELPVLGVLRPHCNMGIRRIQGDIGPYEGSKLLPAQASMRRSEIYDRAIGGNFHQTPQFVFGERSTVVGLLANR